LKEVWFGKAWSWGVSWTSMLEGEARQVEKKEAIKQRWEGLAAGSWKNGSINGLWAAPLGKTKKSDKKKERGTRPPYELRGEPSSGKRFGKKPYRNGAGKENGRGGSASRADCITTTGKMASKLVLRSLKGGRRSKGAEKLNPGFEEKHKIYKNTIQRNRLCPNSLKRQGRARKGSREEAQ